MKKHLHYLIICVLLAMSANLYAQFDTEFWFAAPYATPQHDASNRFRFVFTSSDKPSIITITQPANQSFIPIARSIPANTTEIVDLTGMNGVNVDQSNVISNYGFKITATTPVFCYYDLHSTVNIPLNTELVSLKGKNALGTDFLIPMQDYLTTRTYSKACFLILATEDETEISITPTRALEGHPANVTFTQTLKAGQFYVARALAATAAGHPAGSVVTSNKKVAITVGDDSMSGTPWGGCEDMGADQIVPTNMLGLEYIAVQGYAYQNGNSSGNTGPYDRVFVLATEDNTQVMLNNTPPVITLHRGETHQYGFSTNPFTAGTAVHIKSDKPIYVSQVSGYGCEVGWCILPAIDCRGSNAVSVSRSFSTPFYLTLLTQDISTNKFTFNGKTGVITRDDFKVVPNTGGVWQFAQKLITTDLLPIGGYANITNTSGLFHLGVVHAYQGGTCRFGYFSDFASYKFNITSLSGNLLCEGETLELLVNNIPGTNPQWTLPDGQTSLTTKLLIPETDQTHSGNYTISATAGSCTIMPDTIHIFIELAPNADFIAEDVCFPSPIAFTNTSTHLSDDPAYFWDFGDGSSFSDAQNPTHSYPEAGTYTVQLRVSSFGKCMDSVQHEVTVLETKQSYDTAKLCKSELPLHYGDTAFHNAGSYDVSFNDTAGCDSIVHLNVIVYHENELHFSDTVCTGLPYNKYGFDISGDDLKEAGEYSSLLIYTNENGCDSSHFLTLQVYASELTLLMMPENFCDEHYAILRAESPLPFFSWNTGDSISTIRVDSMGTYVVTAYGYDCLAKDSITINECCPPANFRFPNIITPSTPDGLNDWFASLENFMPYQSEVYIYNRWGRVVFKSKELQFKWDGTVNGKIEQGVYYYDIVINQHCKYRGVITVK